MGQGIGELEAMVDSREQEYKLSPHWADVLVEYLNKANMDELSVVAAAYWVVYRPSIRGVLSRVRTTLVELVAELVTQTPDDRAVPDKATTDRAVEVVIYGDNNTVSLQHAGDSGLNTAVTASGAGATAIGSQTANGGNASVMGSQTVQGDNNTVAGRDDAAAKEPVKESWWRGTRKRGVLITVATVVAAAVAVFAWIGWTPWS